MEMETNNWYKTEEEQQMAAEVIALEQDALDKWFNGDISGYKKLWSEDNFSYLDSNWDHIIHDKGEIMNFLLSVVEGKLHADSYDFVKPRVQWVNGMGILTYQLFAHTNFNDMRYNCIEIYVKNANGDWTVIQSTWSFIRPMDMDFSKKKTVV